MWILVVTVAIGALIVILYMLSPLISPTRIKLRGAHVLITGGSLGIGKSIAVEVAKRGANVTLLARNQARLMEAKTEVENNFEDPKAQKVFCVSADVSKDYAIIEKVVAQAEEKLGPVDMLVNCAGISVNGKFEDIPVEDFQRLMSVNYLGAVYTTRAVIRGMKARKRGRIVLVSSQAGQLGVFGYSAYSPTKFALRGLAECLQMELKPYNIRVTLSFPPDTDTPGFIEENVTKIRETKIISETSGLYQPDYVARKLVNDMVRGNFFSYVGLDGYMLASLTCGMSPVTSIMEAAQQVLTVGLFRAISLFYLENFDRIIQRCKDEDDLKAAIQADSSKSNVKSS